MTISLNAVEVKHERRIRLLFSSALDSGAFGAPPPTFSGGVIPLYVLTCEDSFGFDPGISAAMIVTGNPSVVELALSADLVKGSLYSISAVSVPGVDLSVTPEGSVLSFRYGLNAELRDVEPIQLNRDALLYGVDLLWNGEDYQETASGDLDRIGGTANVTKALYRGMESHGLTWDQSYGARVRDFVDSPSTTTGTLKGRLMAQILKDPRVKGIKVDITTDDEDTYLNFTPTLVSGEILKPVSMVVPNG